jgi:sulfite exporter TauE/SafE
MTGVAEAIALGFGSGPVCIASCGPVLAPWLGAAARPLRDTLRLLALFLGGRLAGYLLFAAIVWRAGAAVPLSPGSRSLVYALSDFGLAIVLAFALLLPRRCQPRQPRGRLVQIGTPERLQRGAGFTLGLLNGLNLCPPFVAAGVRAAESPNLTGALLFFLCFFAGTAVWFVPALALAPARRYVAVARVARFAMAVVAVYYAYLGLIGAAGWALTRNAVSVTAFLRMMNLHA